VSNSRIQIWLVVIVIGIGLLGAAILALWGYAGATAPRFHPDVQAVPSAMHSIQSPEWAQAINEARQIARASLSEQNLPGLSVAVGARGEMLWAGGFGWTDLESRKTVEPETRFKIGSASIPLTSAAVGLLLEGGQLKLDDEIQTYVPEFPKKQWPVTLRQLMGHVAGVAPDEGGEEPVWTRCGRAVEGLPRFARHSLLFEPGTRHRYSSYGWRLVSAAVEAVADEPFSRFMRTRIFDRLSMPGTRADTVTTDPVAGEATYYFPRFAADPRYGPQETDNEDFSCFSGSGAFLSTPSDLVRFAMAFNGGNLLQPATVQLLQTSQRLPSGQETGYGLGWDVETVALGSEQTRSVGHDGELRGGMVSSLMTFPEQGIVVAVTANISFADTASIALKIADAFAKVKERGTSVPRP
jgi:serine beta-lactamase-like protein LACTB, mitochondrial